MEKLKRLGDAELEIMLAVWGAGEPVQSTYIHEKLKGSRDWALPAVITSLNRLVDKGYRPLVEEGAYKAAEGRSLLDRLYGSSVRRLTAALVDGGQLSREDLAELRDYLDHLEVE